VFDTKNAYEKSLTSFTASGSNDLVLSAIVDGYTGDFDSILWTLKESLFYDATEV